MFLPTIYPTLKSEGDKLAPMPNIAPLIAIAPPKALDHTLKANSPSLTNPPTRADIPISFKLFCDFLESVSCPVLSTAAVATPSGKRNWAFKINALLNSK